MGLLKTEIQVEPSDASLIVLSVICGVPVSITFASKLSQLSVELLELSNSIFI